MADEIIFKRAIFDGFDKAEVIQYISNLKKRISDLNSKAEEMKTELKSKDEKNKELENEIASLNERIASLNDEKINEINEINLKHKEEISKLENDVSLRASDLEKSYQEKYSYIDRRYTSEINSLKDEIEKSKTSDEEKEPDIKAQAQLGSAILDVRRFSDMLIWETVNKINDASDSADENAKKSLSDLAEVTAQVKDAKEKINALFDEILLSNNNSAQIFEQFEGSLKTPYNETIDKFLDSQSNAGEVKDITKN